MKNLIVIFAFASVTAFMNSCKEDETPDTTSAHLDLYLKDLPGLYDEVNIDVQAVEIHVNAGWHTYPLMHPGVHNLLKLTDGLDTLMISEDVDPGTISQIRLILGENNSVVVDGVSYDLSTPSAETSGLKLNVHYDFESGMAYTFWIDFDAEKSIVIQGNGSYSLKPVLSFLTPPI